MTSRRTHESPAEHAARSFPQIADHVLLPYAGSILAAHQRLGPRISQSLIEEVVSLVPEDWFVGDPPDTYVEYLSRRVHSIAFAEEAERARLRG